LGKDLLLKLGLLILLKHHHLKILQVQSYDNRQLHHRLPFDLLRLRPQLQQHIEARLYKEK
jgi:hypothetical protein